MCKFSHNRNHYGIKVINHWLSDSNVPPCKRWPFGLQNTANGTMKGGKSQRDLPPFGKRKKSYMLFVRFFLCHFSDGIFIKLILNRPTDN